MIASITKGENFTAIMKYATKGGKDHSFVSFNSVYSADTQGIIEEFKSVANNYRNGIKSVSNPCWQCSLSLHPSETLSDDEWKNAVGIFLEKMGLGDDFQHVAIRHRDTDHDHVHIVVNRVRMDGKRLWNPRNDHYISNQACAEIEQELGLFVTNHNAKTADKERQVVKKLSKNEIEQAVRTEEKPARMVLAEHIEKATDGRPGVRQFIERLQMAGVTVTANIASTGRMNGFGFGFGDVNFKGSEVGASWKILEKKIDYEQDRDATFLARFKAGAGVFGNIERSGSGAAGSGEDLEDTRSGREQTRSAGRTTVSDHDINAVRDIANTSTNDLRPSRSDGRNQEGVKHISAHNTEPGGRRESPVGDVKRIAVADSSTRKVHDRDDEEADERVRNGEKSEPNQGLDTHFLLSNIDHNGSLFHAIGKFFNEHYERTNTSVTDRTASDAITAIGRSFAKDSKKSTQEATKQLNAIGISHYDIVYIKNGGQRTTFKAGLNSVESLRGLNVNGADIYLNVNYYAHKNIVLIDDVTDANLEKLRQSNMPYVSVRTSDNNNQVWLSFDCDLPSQARLNLSRYFTEFLDGDKAAIGSERIGRLAGFANKKPSRKDDEGHSPWITCDTSRSGLISLTQELVDSISNSVKPARSLDLSSSASVNVSLMKRYQGLAKAIGGSDDSRTDFAVCCVLLGDKVNPAELAKVVEFIRNDDKNDPADYARRTVLKADQKVQLEGEPSHKNNGPELQL